MYNTKYCIVNSQDFSVSVQRCPIKQSPANGYLQPPSCPTNNGATCTVGCNNGYHLSDTTNGGQIQCMVDNTQTPVWSGANLACQGAY